MPLRLFHIGGNYHHAARSAREHFQVRHGRDPFYPTRLGRNPVASPAQRRKGDQRKIALARRIRLETTTSLSCIAGQLQMGSWTNASNLHSRPKAELDFQISDASTQKHPRGRTTKLSSIGQGCRSVTALQIDPSHKQRRASEAVVRGIGSQKEKAE